MCPFYSDTDPGGFSLKGMGGGLCCERGEEARVLQALGDGVHERRVLHPQRGEGPGGVGDVLRVALRSLKPPRNISSATASMRRRW